MPFGVLLSVFLMALLGGMHCAAMCGGIAIAAEQKRPSSATIFVHRSRNQWWAELCVMHAGRITTYMLLGAALGAFGATVWRQDYLPLQRWLYALGSLMLVLTGVWLLRGRVMGMEWIERMAAKAAAPVGRIAGRLSAGLPAGLRPSQRAMPMLRRYGMGLAWGLVPCGMVYGALALALLAGNAASGALVMGAFGLGTLPNLLVMSGMSGYLRQWSRKRGVRVASAALVIGFGVLGVARAVWLPETLAQHGFCVVF
ncbi:sulfite exporter TauE/SafE family protein [Cupriavidus pauculus]|uniref:sulfite exporter TauE/SafE family protein n=1 Tax=Cupriavidus pauculus TaxID=82633 RepID=UPI003F5B3913